MPLELQDGYYGSPRWTYEILDCAMPMTFDTYSNCAHQCLYCFSFFQRAIGASADDYLSHKVRAVNVDKVKRMFLEPDKYAGQFKNYIKRRMTLQWGGLSDGFDWYEKKFRKSLELLRFFNSIDYPISISTKGVWFLDDPEYTEVLRGKKNVHFKYSIITANEDHAKKIEPGTPSTAERLEAMRKLNELGIGATTLRFRPFILGTSEQSIDPLFEKAAEVGCYSVTTEFLGWESRASATSKTRLDALSKVLGYDVWEFYKKNSARGSGLLRLNYDLKRPYILQMKKKAEEVGLKFFVSDAHHKEESYHAGCCGLPEDGPLSNVNHGQYAHAIKIAKDKGFVQWSDISEEAGSLLKDIPLIAAEGFPSDTAERTKRQYQSMYDYMHDIWNNPVSWQSPARYFGGALVPAQADDKGDVIYVYNKPFIEEGLRLPTVNAIAKELRMVGKDNADRFDEMTADGSNFGHIAYPVYVLSRQRWANATTIGLLEKSRVNFHLVVPKEDSKYYEETYPTVDIIVLPKNNTTIRQARQYVYDISKEEGTPYVWMLNDNLVDINMRAVMSKAEAFAEDYSNIGILGISHVEDNVYPFYVNYPVQGMYLINLNTGIGFDTGNSELYTIEELALGNLGNGFVNVVLNDNPILFSQQQGGGSSNLYNRPNALLESAKIVANAYPMYAYVEDAPKPLGGRLVVDWKAMSVTLKSRNVELLMKGE